LKCSACREKTAHTRTLAFKTSYETSSPLTHGLILSIFIGPRFIVCFLHIKAKHGYKIMTHILLSAVALLVDERGYGGIKTEEFKRYYSDDQEPASKRARATLSIDSPK
jgi:hypothetical protein